MIKLILLYFFYKMTINTEAEFFCTMISWILDNPYNERRWSKVLHNKLNQVEMLLSEENRNIFYTVLSESNYVKEFISKYN